LCVCVHARVCVFVCVSTYESIATHNNCVCHLPSRYCSTSMCVCIYISIHMLVRMHVYVCVYKSFVTHKNCSCGSPSGSWAPSIPKHYWIHRATRLQHVIAWLQCAAVCCSMLQYVAVCYSWFPQNTQRRASAAHHCIIARCCRVPQCVAVCCSRILQNTQRRAPPAHAHSPSELQCDAVCCGAMQYVAVQCSVLQRVAVRCNALQYVAVCCSVLQLNIAAYTEPRTSSSSTRLQWIAVRWIVLQCVAVRCTAWCCTAWCCRVLQCVAAEYRRIYSAARLQHVRVICQVAVYIHRSLALDLYWTHET